MTAPVQANRYCWTCGYALRELPRGSVCPECGRPVPELIIACRAHDHGFAVTLVLLLIGLALVGALLWWRYPRAAPGDSGELSPFVVVVAMLAGLVLVNWWRRHRIDWTPERTIVVTRDGIEIESSDRGRQRFSASIIASVAVKSSLLTAKRRVRIATAHTVTVHDDLGFLPREDAERLATAIRAVIEGQQPCSPTPPSNHPDHPTP